MQDVDILVSGKPVKKHAHDGKIFIVAKPGTQYEVRVKNNSTSRIMAVAAIDGLNVISGKPAETDGPGYVIEGYNSYTIKGWRTSNDEVRAFEFSKKGDSYAAKSEDGDPKSVGVIGVVIHAERVKKPKVIREKEYIPYYVDRFYPYHYEPYPYRRSYPYFWCGGSRGGYIDSITTTSCITATGGNHMMASNQNVGQSVMMNSCSTSNGNTDMLRSASLSASPEFDMGTKFSEDSLEDRVTDTSFKSSHILNRIEIFYASEEQLRAMGVPIDKDTKVAFPQAFADRGFCKAPKG